MPVVWLASHPCSGQDRTDLPQLWARVATVRPILPRVSARRTRFRRSDGDRLPRLRGTDAIRAALGGGVASAREGIGLA